MARTKTEENAITEKSPKKNSVGRYSFQFLIKIIKNHWKISEKKVKTAVNGTEHTVIIDTGKIINRKLISNPILFSERKIAPKIGDTITPKNRHCLRGVDGKYIQWNKIMRDVLNGKLNIVQNQRTEWDSESEEGEMNDEERYFENHVASEKDGRC